MSNDKDMLRIGRCRACRRNFAWTGSPSTVPDCSCGHEHTRDEFFPGQEFHTVCHGWLEDAVKHLRKLGQHEEADRLFHGR